MAHREELRHPARRRSGEQGNPAGYYTAHRNRLMSAIVAAGQQIWTIRIARLAPASERSIGINSPASLAFASNT